MFAHPKLLTITEQNIENHEHATQGWICEQDIINKKTI